MAEREEHIEGQRGGAAEPYVYPPYAATEAVAPGILLKDRVRWSAVWAGLVVTFATQLVLGALVFAIAVGSRPTVPPDTGTLGIWTAIVAFVALFLGGWTAARLAGIAGRWNGIWNGAIVWALTLTLGTLAAALGIGGVLGARVGGLGAPLAGAPGQELSQVLGTAVSSAWWFFIGAIIALIAAGLGGLAGSRPEEVVVSDEEVVAT